jgi:glutathione S-transferase
MQIYAKGIEGIVIERPTAFGTPKFREINPIGRIPVLDIDGDLMPESEVIAEYLEELYPHPRLLGDTPRETAHIRTLARIGDVYLMNNMFMLSGQTYIEPRNEGAIAFFAGQVARNIKALNSMVGVDGFACCGRLTMADCALVPGLFMVENVLPAAGKANPIEAHQNVATYWKQIQTNDHAARTLSELNRGLQERREMIASGAFVKIISAARAAFGEG